MIKLTEDEKVILKNIDKRYKWIARDECGTLSVFVDKPSKFLGMWNNKRHTGWYHINVFAHLFQSIKWDDKEPYLIENLLKEDDYDEEENGVPFDDEE